MYLANGKSPDQLPVGSHSVTEKTTYKTHPSDKFISEPSSSRISACAHQVFQERHADHGRDRFVRRNFG